MEKFKIRILLCHYWKQDFKPIESARKYGKWKMKKQFQFAERSTGSRSSMEERRSSEISHFRVDLQRVDSEALKFHQSALVDCLLNSTFPEQYGTFTLLV